MFPECALNVPFSPAVVKQLKLARSLARGMVDHSLKPDAIERKAIKDLLKLPPTRSLPAEGKQLLWKFRFVIENIKNMFDTNHQLVAPPFCWRWITGRIVNSGKSLSLVFILRLLFMER
jgi:hypothetical protein